MWPGVLHTCQMSAHVRLSFLHVAKSPVHKLSVVSSCRYPQCWRLVAKTISMRFCLLEHCYTSLLGMGKI